MGINTAESLCSNVVPVWKEQRLYCYCSPVMQDKCIQTLIAKKNKTIILGIGIVLLVYDDSIQIQQSHHT